MSGFSSLMISTNLLSMSFSEDNVSTKLLSDFLVDNTFLRPLFPRKLIMMIGSFSAVGIPSALYTSMSKLKILLRLFVLCVSIGFSIILNKVTSSSIFSSSLYNIESIVSPCSSIIFVGVICLSMRYLL